ncbi:phosphoserine phosphatase SerB [Acaricomes phytoseiuli]|uniref:phosphoserine phosphatase SerB n=1 Tax=Acaricomes phytoseiuli TaxID=291968 RepID=UPI00035C4D2E|nr:phosphoserine phosphatase SerB [Acaricomes phytoseiuli]
MHQSASRTFCYGPGLDREAAAALLGSSAEHSGTLGEITVWSASSAGPGSLDPPSPRIPADIEIVEVPWSLLSAERKLFILDVDSTLIEQEVIELLARFAGKEAEVREVTEAAMRGEPDFEQSLRSRVAQLAGLPVSVLREVRDLVRLSPGAQELISGAHAAGHRVAAVSGGFQQILEPLAESWNLDAALANDLGVQEGKLTGTVNGTVVDKTMKATKLHHWAEDFDVPVHATIAIGDGANDLDMLAAAGLSLAYRAKPAVRAAADAAINRLDLALPLSGTELSRR